MFPSMEPLRSWNCSPVRRSRCIGYGPRRGSPVRRILVCAALGATLLNAVWLFFASSDTLAAFLEDSRRAEGDFDGGLQLVFSADHHATPRDSTTTSRAPQASASTRLSVKGKKTASTIIRSNSNGSDLSDIEIQKSNQTMGSSEFPPTWCYGGPINTSGAINKYLENTNTRCLDRTEPTYFLTAVLLVRIYTTDHARLTSRELIQWLQYLSYAGVEHVYVYDAYLYRNESQSSRLSCFVQTGYVSYVDWSHKARPKYTLAGTQVTAYQDCLTKYGCQSVWQTAIDIDEYPRSPRDIAPGFLARLLARIGRRDPTIGEVSMANYLYLGKPLVRPLLIDRLWRRTKKPANSLVKPIYRPGSVRFANVHHNSLRAGARNFAPSERALVMNHYWGARLQNWGEDTPEILERTTVDMGMEPAVSALNICLDLCPSGCCRGYNISNP